MAKLSSWKYLIYPDLNTSAYIAILKIHTCPTAELHNATGTNHDDTLGVLIDVDLGMIHELGGIICNKDQQRISFETHSVTLPRDERCFRFMLI